MNAAPWLAALTPAAEPPPVRFVPASELPRGEAYEAFIARTGGVPTRDDLHDDFNRRVWLAQPRLKARLNALQAAEIARHGIGPTRGPLRDALTLFDEFGALWPDAPPALAAALRARDWAALFVTQRSLWARTRIVVFGHALLAQLQTAPRKGLTAHVVLAGAGDLADWPAEAWAGKPFWPLPVLGIPGWWAANEVPGFYDDATVFRPSRTKTPRRGDLPLRNAPAP